MSDNDFLRAEMWLAKRLSDHGTLWDTSGIFDGSTTSADRCARFRKAILERGLKAVIVGRREGRPETYQNCFERLYGELLNIPHDTNTERVA